MSDPVILFLAAISGGITAAVLARLGHIDRPALAAAPVALVGIAGSLAGVLLASLHPVSALAGAGVGAIAGSLAGATVTDLRDRSVHMGAFLALASAGALALGVDGGPAITGAFFGLALAAGLWAFGLLYSRLRGYREEDGSVTEAFGAGDIPAWTAAGALLGAPMAVAVALVASLLVQVALGGVRSLYRRLRGRPADLREPAPMIPSIVLTLIVFASFPAGGLR